MGSKISCFSNASHESKNDKYRYSMIKTNPNDNNIQQLTKNRNDEGEIKRRHGDAGRSTGMTNKTRSAQAARDNISYFLHKSRPKGRGTGPKTFAPNKSSPSKKRLQISLPKSEPKSNFEIPSLPPIPNQPLNYKKQKPTQQTVLPSNSQNKEPSSNQKPPASNILDLANEPKQKKPTFFANVSENIPFGKHKRPAIKESGAQTKHTLKSDLKQLDKWSILTVTPTSPTSPLDNFETTEPLPSPEITKLRPSLNTQDPVLPATIIPKQGPQLKSPNKTSPTVHNSKAGPHFENNKALHPPLSFPKPLQHPSQSQPWQQPVKKDTHSTLQKPQNEAFAELKLGPPNSELLFAQNIPHSQQPLQQHFPKSKQVPVTFKTNVRVPVPAQNAQSDPIPSVVGKSNTPKPSTQSNVPLGIKHPERPIILPASGSANLKAHSPLVSNQVPPPTISNNPTFKTSAHEAPPTYIPEQRPPLTFPKPKQQKFPKPQEITADVIKSSGEPVNNFSNLRKPLITPMTKESKQLDQPHDISKPEQPKNAPKWGPTPVKNIQVSASQQQNKSNQENNYMRKSEKNSIEIPQSPKLDPPPIPISKPPSNFTRPLAPYNAQKPQSNDSAFRPPPGIYKSVSPPTNFPKPKPPLDDAIILKPFLPAATNSDTVPLPHQNVPNTHPPSPDDKTMKMIQTEFENGLDFSLKKYKDIMSKLIDTKQPFTETQLTKYHEENKKIILAAFREGLTPVLELKHENVKNLFEEQYRKLEKSIKSQLLIFTRKHEIIIEKVTTMIKDCTMEADMEYADLVEQFDFNDGNSKENMFLQHHNACVQKAVVKFDELVIKKGLEVADFWKTELIHKMEETKEELILEKFGNKKMKSGD